MPKTKSIRVRKHRSLGPNFAVRLIRNANLPGFRVRKTASFLARIFSL